MSLFGFCNNKTKKEIYSKEDVDNIVRNLMKEITKYKNVLDFQVVSGSLTMTNGTASKTVAYPNGFNAENCTVLSLGVHNKDSSASVMTYGYLETSTGYVSGALGHMVKLTNSGIELTLNNPVEHNNGSATFEFRIVFMLIDMNV